MLYFRQLWIYFRGGWTTNSGNPCRYDHIQDIWIPALTYPDNQFNETHSFVLKNEVYIFTTKNLYKYDVANPEFELVGNVFDIHTNNSLYGSVFFVLNDVPYSILGGYSGTGPQKGNPTELWYDAGTTFIHSTQEQKENLSIHLENEVLSFYWEYPPTTMDLLSIHGKTLSQFPVSNGHNNISTAHLEKGIYILSIKTGNKIISQKIIK